MEKCCHRRETLVIRISTTSSNTSFLNSFNGSWRWGCLELFEHSRHNGSHSTRLLIDCMSENLLERCTQDVLTIIENKYKVRNSRSKPVVSQVKACDINANSSSEIAKLTHAVNQQTSAV
nr:hypothetical protein [Tanacetum cinerariifolium]